jgi:hypothetical protein
VSQGSSEPVLQKNKKIKVQKNLKSLNFFKKSLVECGRVVHAHSAA